METNSSVSVVYDKKFINGRFGMSTILHNDPVNENIARIIIFGGSYYAGKNLIAGMTNEVLVFHVFVHIL